MHPLKAHLFIRNFMHSLDPKPAMAKRHQVKQTHSMLFWYMKEGKHAGYLSHQKKTEKKPHIKALPRKSKPSYPRITAVHMLQKQRYFLSKTRLNQQNCRRTKQENFVPPGGIGSVEHKTSDSLSLLASCTSRQADPEISLLHQLRLHRPEKATA